MEPTITTLATTVAAKGFTGLMAGLIEKYFRNKTSALLGAKKDEVETDLRDHMEVVFEKCITTKTIINDTPVNLLEIYVDQRFGRKGTPDVVDQYNMVEMIKVSGKSFVLTGTGGGGKSFFMKYLWLSFLEDNGGRLPLFIEIRQINSSSTVNISDFLYHSVVRTGATISQRNFDRAIKAGEIILFLDGFDEIVPEKRVDAEYQIQQLRENNPKLTIVMTSRPDDRFSGWHQFQHIEVMPMLKKEAELLISRAQYDEPSKARLLKRIKTGLYESHESFLSTPLLAYMMLLTIARNPDIPNKMSAFYELAFEALYNRHDTAKGVVT
jgi:predicted NACHT family NTPase